MMVELTACEKAGLTLKTASNKTIPIKRRPYIDFSFLTPVIVTLIREMPSAYKRQASLKLLS